MSEVKLLRNYRLTKNWQHSKQLPTGGVWHTVCVEELNTENPIYTLVCVYPTDSKRKHLERLKVPKVWITDLMEEVEIVVNKIPQE